MGGASRVVASDTMEEVIEKAKEWYKNALQAGLFPRRFVYEPNLVIEFQHCDRENCWYCGGEPMNAYLTIVDMNEKPEDAESELPFPIFSESLTEEERGKRFFGFISVHTWPGT